MNKKIFFILLFCFLITGCKSNEEQSFEELFEKGTPITTQNQIDLFGDQLEPHVVFEGRNGDGYAKVNLYHCDENYVIYEDDSVMVVNKGTYDNPHFKMIKDNTEIFDFTCFLYPSNGLSNGDEVDFHFNDIIRLSELGYSLKDDIQNYIVEGLNDSTTVADTINVDEVISFINTLLPESHESYGQYYSNLNIESIYFATAKKTAITDIKSFVFIIYSYDDDYVPTVKGLLERHTKEYCSYWMNNPYNDNGLKWDDDGYYEYFTDVEEYIQGKSADYDFVQLY